MDFKQLEAFVTAVDEGSFSNAAERLQLSQSMVTIHVRNLEAELGTRLLNRTTRTMELSPDGRVFYDYAQKMLALNRDSIFALRRAGGDDAAITVVATPYIIRYSLAPRAAEYMKLRPETVFDFVGCSHGELQNRLRAEDVPFAFSTTKLMTSEYAVRHYESARPVVITPNAPRFRALPAGPFPKERFGEERLITRSSATTLQQEFLRWSRLHIPDVKVRVAAAVDDTESIKRLVAADAGVSIMSEVPAREDIARGQLLAFPLEGARPYHLYFLYKKRYLTAAQVAFRDFLLERAAPGDAMGEDE